MHVYNIIIIDLIGRNSYTSNNKTTYSRYLPTIDYFHLIFTQKSDKKNTHYFAKVFLPF